MISVCSGHHGNDAQSRKEINSNCNNTGFENSSPTPCKKWFILCLPWARCVRRGPTRGVINFKLSSEKNSEKVRLSGI